MNIVVTGGAGFIGSHVADRMLEEGHTVTVIDNLSTGKISNVPPGAAFVEADICDAAAVENLWVEKKFDVMMHLAAQMDVRRSVADPIFDAQTNVIGLLTLLEAGRRSGLKKVVFSSTGGAGYDDSVPFPTSEAIPANPVSPYGITKNVSERYLGFYGGFCGLQWTALRLGNVYGPRQNPHGEAGVIAIFAKKLIEGVPPRIHGDGLQTRDYVYVRDVAQAFSAALKKDYQGFVNIGTSIETSVVQIAEALGEALGSSLKSVHGPVAQGEVRRSCLDNTLAHKVLNWQPTVSIQQGIRATADFFRKQAEDPDVR
ncbi:MAG: NAD-dependent epimerase/dehydratase family protein [bacterium]